MQTYEYILISLSVGQFLAMIIGGYIFLQKPSVLAKKIADDAADELENQKTACKYKHNRIDEVFIEIKDEIQTISKTFEFFQRNDFKHIEKYSRSIDNRMAKLEGQNETIVKILTEVLNKK
jgi:hypothetical protein